MTKRPGLLAAVTALILFAGCGGTGVGSGTAPSPAGSPGVTPSAPQASGAGDPRVTGTTPRPGGAAPGATASRPPSAGGPPPGGPGGVGNPGGATTANPDDGGLGSMSRAFLRPAPYTRITLELASASGAAPSASVEDNLSATLQSYSGKSIRHADHGFAGKGGACWTLADVNRVASQQRLDHTGGTEAALFLAFLDGSYCDNKNVLGLAFGASAVVIFTNQVTALANPPLTVGPDVYMKSVTVHEVGHILGMVNIGYKSPADHEDPANPHHSNNANSVMYYAIDQGNLIQQFTKGPPVTFDKDDESDLAGLRNGTL